MALGGRVALLGGLSSTWQPGQAEGREAESRCAARVQVLAYNYMAGMRESLRRRLNPSHGHAGTEHTECVCKGEITVEYTMIHTEDARVMLTRMVRWLAEPQGLSVSKEDFEWTSEGWTLDGMNPFEWLEALTMD
jgi:hypothetical protein